MSAILRNKLAQVKQKRRWVCLSRAIGWAIAWVGVVLVLSMGADWLFELPLMVRTAVLAVAGMGAISILFLQGIVQIIRGPDEDELALLVERHAPTLGARLISVIQLTRLAGPEGHSMSLVHALVNQTEEIAQPMDFKAVISTRPLRQQWIGLGIAFLIVLIALAMTAPDSIDLLKRAILVPGIPVPRKTKIELLNPDMIVARGEPLVLSAKARGVVPDAGAFELVYESSLRQRIAVAPRLDDRTIFDMPLSSVQESFKYHVELNDGRSVERTIRSELRPAVSAIQCTQIFPAYTNLPPMRRAVGDLTLLAGSRLQVSVAASKRLKITSSDDPKGSRVLLRGSNLSFPLQVNSSDPSQAESRDRNESAVLLPAGTTGFWVQLLDEQGLSSKDSAVYRIDLVPDKPPTIRVIQPTRKEELATRRATIAIGFEAADDFAVAGVALHLKFDDGEQKPIQLETGSPQKQLKNWYKLDMSRQTISEGVSVEWWLEARDGNNVTGPGVAQSEHFVTRIVSDAEKRTELMNRLNESMSQMNEISESEKDLNSQLGKLITEKGGEQ